MGKYSKGILGPISGLVGTVVGSQWKGRSVMRSRPVISGKEPTEAQMIHRARFTMLSQFLSPINDLLRVGFQEYNHKSTPLNAAFSINSGRAITGTYPSFIIDYGQLVIAKGRLLAPPVVSLAAQAPSQLAFTWVNNAEMGSTNDADSIFILVYNPAKQAYVTRLGGGTRSTGSYNLTLPALWTGDAVHAWAFFAGVNDKISSNSLYVGTATLV